MRQRWKNAFSSALEKQAFKAKILVQTLSVTLAGALNCKKREKGSKQTVCECLNIKQCLDQGVNHVSRTGGHFVFLQVQTVPAATVGVCKPSAEVWTPEACREPSPSPGLQLAWRQAHRRTGSLAPSKHWVGWKAAGNPAPFQCWQALREGEVMGEAVATTQAEEHRGQIWRTTREKAARHLETTQRPERWSPQRSVRRADVRCFLKGANPAK